MKRLPASEAFDTWSTSPVFVHRLSSRMPYVYRPGSDGGWQSTSEALPELLGWPSDWEARVEEAQVRADARYPECAFLDVRGRDPKRPQEERGMTIAVADRGLW